MLKKVSSDISIFPLGIYLNKHRILIISDLHLGYEQVFSKTGAYIPKNNLKKVKKEILSYLKEAPIEKVIINGDIKENISFISESEKEEILDLILFLKKSNLDICFIKGNHDSGADEFFKSLDIDLENKFLIVDNIFITHGHLNLVNEFLASPCNIIVIGHEHASISIDSFISYSYKVIAKANIEGKELYALPAISNMKKGRALNSRKRSFLSPILKKAKEFEYFTFKEEWFLFLDKDIRQ